MANANRTAYEGPPLSGPGILWINSQITASDKLSPELFKKWYEEVHIPDLINAKQGGILACSRYQCADPSRRAPYLAVYSVPDLGFLQSPEFKAAPMTHEMLPGGCPIHKFASFDARFYKRIQLVERPGVPAGRAPILISAAIEPDDEQDFHAWYEKEHLQQLQDECPEWRRCARYELVFKIKNKDQPPGEQTAPKYLALHEFEDGSLTEGEKVVPPVQQTEWTKEVMSNAKEADAAKFRLITTIGDQLASL